MAGLILDASAVLALLRNEPGAKRVANALDEARMSVVNHAEVVSYYAKAGSDRSAIDEMLRALPIELVPVDRDPRLRLACCARSPQTQGCLSVIVSASHSPRGMASLP